MPITQEKPAPMIGRELVLKAVCSCLHINLHQSERVKTSTGYSGVFDSSLLLVHLIRVAKLMGWVHLPYGLVQSNIPLRYLWVK